MTLILAASLVAALAAVPIQQPQEPDVPSGTAEQQPQGGEIDWMVDYSAAKAKAAEEGKDLLLNFTGSDWCIWCKRLDAEVFQQPEFVQKAPQQYVFVKLDYPNDASGQSEEEIAQNEKLKTRFAIQGFPTILVTDAEGRPYAQTGYQPGGAEPYLTHLEELRGAKTARNEALAKAENAEGEERAKFLAEALDALPDELHRHYMAWIEEIVAKGTPELKERFQKRIREMELEKILQDTQEQISKLANESDWDGAIGVIDRFLADVGDEFEPQVRQQVLVVKARLSLEKEDEPTALEALRAAKAIDPEGRFGQAIQQMIEQVESRAKERESEPKEGEPGRDG